MSSEENQDKVLKSARFGREYFDVACTDLAKNLLGQILVRKEGNIILTGKIVETEAYLGGDDLASHTCNGKMTEKTAPSYMAPGTMYIYPVYGMYYLFNISSKGDGACVLIRALEPFGGIEEMKRKRSSFGKDCKKKLKNYKLHQICNGPSKLAICMSIDSRFSGSDLTTSEEIWIEGGPQPVSESQIVKCPRIGVDIGGSLWAAMPLRFYILGNTSVSKRDKDAEDTMKKESLPDT